MAYSVRAIETRYKGHLFRSRLEARWAAMFDLLGWQWTYEPFDLNGWVPDFLLSPLTGDGSEVLVEVKGPASEWEAAKEKIEAATENPSNCLLVGSNLFVSPAVIGNVTYPHLESLADEDGPATFSMYWSDCKLAFLPRLKLHDIFNCDCESAINGSVDYMLTGLVEESFGQAPSDEAARFWGIAHEKTRYTVR